MSIYSKAFFILHKIYRMNTYQPKVSILSSSYNHIQFIDDFISSVYNQDYKNFELIMMDDGSKDGCGERLKELSEQYQFKAIIRENKGFPNALNTLRPLANGDYIVIIAADDIMTKSRLTKQVEFLESHKHLALVACNMQEIDEHGNKGDLISRPFKSGELFKDLLLTTTYILAPTVMIRTSCLDEAGEYDENLRVEDFDMWLRLASKYELGYMDFLAAYYRKHSGNSHGNYKTLFEQKEKVLAKYADSKLGQTALQQHFLQAFLLLAPLKAFQKLAKTYKSRVKFQCSKAYLSAHLKYYFFKKHLF